MNTLISPDLHNFEELRVDRVLNEIREWTVDGKVESNATRSQYKRLLDDFSRSAMAYATSKNSPIREFEYDILLPAIDVVRNIMLSVAGFATNITIDRMVWRHRLQPLHDIKSKKVPEIDKPAIESAVGEYLSLPIRSETIDRLLIDILIAMELYAFGDEMINEYRVPGFAPRSPLKQRHALLTYFNVNFWNGLLFAVPSGVALFSASKAWISWPWAYGIAGVCIFLFIVLWVLSTIALPFNWKRISAGKNKTIELFNAMNSVYAELKSDGPISSNRIYELSRSSAKLGVIWPAPLFALLDDSLRRNARL